MVQNLIDTINQSLIKNRVNRYCVILIALFATSDYLLWQNALHKNAIYVYTSLGYYPLQILLIITPIHLAISLYSYKKDPDISRILLGSNLFYFLLVLVLILEYVVNK